MILMFMAMFRQVGAMFDDGGNFDEEYDDDFNDYPMVHTDWVQF